LFNFIIGGKGTKGFKGGKGGKGSRGIGNAWEKSLNTKVTKVF